MSFYLANTVEVYPRPPVPVFLAVPQLNALDHPTVSGEIQRMCPAAGRNAFTNDQFFLTAVAEVYDHALEVDGAVADPQLNRAKLSIVLAHVNIIVVVVAVNVSISKMHPLSPVVLSVSLRANRRGKSHAYQQAEEPYVFSLDHSSLRVFKGRRRTVFAAISRLGWVRYCVPPDNENDCIPLPIKLTTLPSKIPPIRYPHSSRWTGNSRFAKLKSET